MAELGKYSVRGPRRRGMMCRYMLVGRRFLVLYLSASKPVLIHCNIIHATVLSAAQGFLSSVLHTMAPSAIETVVQPIDQLTGDERARQLKKTVGDRPLDRFTYGPHPISGNQTELVKQVRIPTFSNPLDERA